MSESSNKGPRQPKAGTLRAAFAGVGKLLESLKKENAAQSEALASQALRIGQLEKQLELADRVVAASSPVQAQAAGQHVNTYRISFMVRCPNNDHVIRYSLSIESKDTIMVEDIVTAVDALPAEGFQEDIAAQLEAALPGLHTIIAHHHGVDIETRRGAIA